MKRFTILVAILSLFAGVAGAKGLVSYQGEIDLGYSTGLEELSQESVNLHTIQGIKVGDYFSTGIGTGIDFYYSYDDTSEAMVPLYLNVKGYLPFGDRVSGFISCDAGWAVGVTDDIKKVNGISITPSIGVVWGVVKVQVGYYMQSLDCLDLKHIKMNSLQAKIGIMF